MIYLILTTIEPHAFPNGILSLPLGHLSIDAYKKFKGQRIEKYFWTEKENLLELEKTTLTAMPRLDFLNTILLQNQKLRVLTVPNLTEIRCFDTKNRDRKAF